MYYFPSIDLRENPTAEEQAAWEARFRAARSFIVVVMTALYFKAHDPLFLVLDAMVLIGLLPSSNVVPRSARARKRLA